MTLTYTENDLSVEEYKKLRAAVGWQAFSARQSGLALENSSFTICARDENWNPVGMGRVIGDGATICYIQDLAVLPDFHRQHIGTRLMNHMEHFVRSLVHGDEQMRLCLMCASGREKFYESCGFFARPTPEFGPGMMQWLKPLGKE